MTESVETADPAQQAQVPPDPYTSPMPIHTVIARLEMEIGRLRTQSIINDLQHETDKEAWAAREKQYLTLISGLRESIEKGTVADGEVVPSKSAAAEPGTEAEVPAEEGSTS